MTGPFAQSRIQSAAELLQQIKGHEGLDGAGKAAAVDPVSAAALKIVLAQGQGHSHILMLDVTGGDDILQVHIGGMAALLYKGQEFVKIPFPQSLDLLRHPGVVLINVDGPQDRPVRAALPKGGDGGVEFRLRHLGQDLLAKVGADLLQFPGDGSIFVGQVGVAGLAVDDAQSVTAGAEIEVYRLDHGVVFVTEVNGHQVAYSRGGLVHKPTGLAEEHILRVLADLSDFRLTDFALKEESVDNGADEHLEGGRGAQAGAGQHRALTVGIEALYRAPKLGKPGADTPNQSGSRIDFRLLGHQGVQGHHAQGIPLGQDPDLPGPVYGYRRPGIQIHSRGQYPAPLMIRMVAADLRPPRRGEIPLRLPPKFCQKPCIQHLLLILGKNKTG